MDFIESHICTLIIVADDVPSTLLHHLPWWHFCGAVPCDLLGGRRGCQGGLRAQILKVIKARIERIFLTFKICFVVMFVTIILIT